MAGFDAAGKAYIASPTRNIVFALVCLLLLGSCATARDQASIRDGLLTLNLRQAAFLEEWGKPDRTYATTGEEIIRAGWNGGGGSFFRGKEAFEVWIYEARKTELVFSRRKVLVGWKTDATVKELSAPSTPSK
jgi:hypothetical protein